MNEEDYEDIGMLQALFDRADFRKSCCFDCDSCIVEATLPEISLFGGSLLGEKDRVDVGEDTSRRDGDAAEQLVQLLIVLDGKGDVTGHNTALLVVTGGVSGKLQDLSAEVFQHCGEVDGCSGSHTGGVLSLTKVPSDTSDGELKSSLGGRAGLLLLAASSFTFS